ncbi:fatty acid desaturase [Bradyrhizobium sp. WBOS7]|uniref:Fatty acid desaturase n=1 Tax=Bradyrhizobium betae TaxID=244734 RepID=A0AAE9SSQ5_9BRAD|nr:MULTISPECIES: fatty acid desaturase [Bradyrhizobium]MDD1574560.1 fatty acid desaturase [Bradyrhizobium sp. WBOS1]UUO34731.1 fatty acid desaturase [Bradyrhizobium sp. WBOS01]MDD1531013.1 fatty acid desaturase [Bradyrhizobium sp. WBOS2]MDD1580596.1 fatty acid desaturase [Bradyrhizobium sp. WBOS7]MDD1603854.1 fatty acid desaturase [Bradyrhizobium sp. WBOS16]
MTDTTVSEPGHRLKPLTPAMLRDLSVRSDLKGAMQTTGHYGAILLVGAAIAVVSSRWGVLWALPLMALQGYVVAFLFMAVHETAHKTAFRSRGLNLAVGHVSAFIIGLPYEYYCLFHWDHHRYTQDPDKDPELIVGVKPTSDTQLAIAYSGLLQVAGRLRLMLGHAITGNVTVPWIPESKRAVIVREARVYVALYALLLALSLWFTSALLLWVWIVPLIIGQFFLRPYLYAEHTGCERTRSAFENTRTTYTAAFVKWFAWNMPYHVEHHAYPSIPFHALPKLNAIVDDEIVHRGHGYIRTTRETWTWFRRQRQAG